MSILYGNVSTFCPHMVLSKFTRVNMCTHPHMRVCICAQFTVHVCDTSDWPECVTQNTNSTAEITGWWTHWLKNSNTGQSVICAKAARL